MIVALALLSAALGAPEDALNEVLREQYRQATDLEARGQYDDAAARYRVVVRGDPDFVQAVVDLGRVLELGDRPTLALAAYASAPRDADAVEALGRLRLALEDHTAAVESFTTLRSLRPAWPGWRVGMAAAIVGDDPEGAAALLLEYLDFVNTSLDDAGVVEVTIEVGEALRAGGSPEPAVALLERLVARFQGDSAAVARLEALLVQFEIDETAADLARAADLPLDPDALVRLRRAREAFAQGRVNEAVALLEALVADQPRSAVAWGALSDARSAAGDVGGAVQAIRAAQALDPLEASTLARLGDLLSEGYGGRFDGEAAHAFARAVRRRSTDPELWVRKARAERRAGMWDLSVASYQQVLRLDPDGPWRAEADNAVAGATRGRPTDVALPEAPGRPATVPEEAWVAFHRAWAWRERGDPDRALSEVEIARAQSPTFVRAVNLEAAIHADRGASDRARDLYRTSLQLDPHQAAVLAVLADLETGAEADALWDRAASGGNPRALWRRARQQADRHAWFSARETLATYFARTTRDPSYDAALQLDAELQARIRAGMALTAGAALAVTGLPLWLFVRRRTGVGVASLLVHHPRAWHDVARVASAIRHEVLKHHTTVLPSVAEAVEVGDVAAAQWAADRLYGPDGALDRSNHYVAELEALGRGVGIRLNLRHRDPTFGPLLAAIRRMERLEADLRRGTARWLPGALLELSDALNGDSYHALGRLVTGLSVLRVEGGLIDGAWAQVLEEPAFQDAPVPRLIVDALPVDDVRVRIYPADLRDVLVNLLRNGAEASIDAGCDRMGVGVTIEEDEITGLQRVAIRVRDDSPHRLTTAMIRGRYISRGLGLAVDLTSRAGGSIHVEAEAGWHKAVVVRLPRAEISEEDWS